MPSEPLPFRVGTLLVNTSENGSRLLDYRIITYIEGNNLGWFSSRDGVCKGTVNFQRYRMRKSYLYVAVY